ncbi:flagellar hook-basal body complex protein FliE [Desulfohalobiaceae bacterium Ax17]|jgi:flagellar hook-basal body complex protein FliE|uniref:flagellar hook-basal body complex protein FliE n=1 Tax=Desulfovulcanus ferrireducens TaxID=2831190 RepID=UPI00207BC227|nr:flagellar hook-basal body complex protein FliE [Desulfovulcanus ferrireducens]MBT8764281.1 flagellar hook-basal body complex protein FliE [Desulfovulcanus ferrireducens]
MAISPLALKAYTNALQAGKTVDVQKSRDDKNVHDSFTDSLKKSLKKVNELQEEKGEMIKAFAAGENQNVHELMITLQKAGLAMQMTSAVRNKVLEAYKELMRMPF